MPAKKTEAFELGGVDSRSNVLNFPSNRSFRCRNWRPMQSGRLRLRWGYTEPTMGAVDVSNPIHTAIYYEQFGGTQLVLFGQGNKLRKYSIATGAVTDIATLSGSNPWGHFRASNRVFYGNGVDFDSFDGTTRRPVGIRSANSTETVGIANTMSTAATGTWATTVLGGYGLFMVYFNPVTGAVGNRMPIGSTFTVGTAGYSLILSGLPDLSGVNAEWVKGIGRTNDGGQVPYWLVDANGNRVVIGNTSTVGTITASTIDANQELPTRNGVPVAGLNKFTRVGNRTFAARDGDINLYYTEDDTNFNTGEFVGSAPESWPSDAIEPMPNGEVPRALHTYRSEGWFFSRNALAIWSAALFQQATNPWRGPWAGGCAGQRAFVETPYGPVWLTPDKQLMSFNQGYSTLESTGYFGPTPISSEYERSRLGQIGDQYISTAEVGYLRDPEKEIDCVYVLSKDKDGATVIVVHDFLIRDARSSSGQGYDATYSGMTPTTLIGTGCTPRQNALDTNRRERLWAGSVEGKLFQLEDGDKDGNSEYTADYIGLVNAGTGNPLVVALEWQGDRNIQISFSKKTSQKVEEWTVGKTDTIEAENNRYKTKIGLEARWIYARLQLTSHSADPDNGGTLTIEGEEIPVNVYGRVNAIIPQFGAGRPEGA